MDPYYSYRHFKEQKSKLERESRFYQEYLNSLLDQEDLKRGHYYSVTRDLYIKPRRRDFAKAAEAKPKAPEDAFWITAQSDAKGSFKTVSEKISRKKKAEETPPAHRFRGIRPFY